jgi:hypothetical protein
MVVPAAAPSGGRRNQPIVSKGTLSSQRVRLVEVMQALNFGRIERLVIAGGQPVLHPPPRIVREIKFGAENGPRPEVSAEDFALKAQVIELFNSLDELRDGVVEALEIKHGLPFHMLICEDAA